MRYRAAINRTWDPKRWKMYDLFEENGYWAITSFRAYDQNDTIPA